MSLYILMQIPPYGVEIFLQGFHSSYLNPSHTACYKTGIEGVKAQNVWQL